MLILHESSSPWDLTDPCVQRIWSATVPIALVLTFLIRSTWTPPRIALRDDQDVSDLTVRRASFIGYPALLCTIAWFEFISWLVVGIYDLVAHKDHLLTSSVSVLISLSWLYGAAKPVFCPKATAYVDLFILYVTHLVFGVLRLGSSIYHHPITPVFAFDLIGMTLNLVGIVNSLGLVSTMPLRLPPQDLKHSPETYASIFDWATFSWVNPLIKLGEGKITKDDVWDLTPPMRSENVCETFNAVGASSLFRRLVLANMYDLALDALLTMVTVLFAFGSPFFLRLILDAIDDPAPEAHSKAYILAFLAFICALAKIEADGQHLFYGRRAAVRIRVQLMNEIHAKSLRRPQFSGVVKGASSGKVINVVIGDTRSVADAVGSAYLLYGTPFELILTGYLMYSLLGVSAFPGYLVIMLGWIIHRHTTKAGASIQRQLSTLRDKRIGLTTELLNILVSLKFFSWEDYWVRRVSEARRMEVEWLNKLYTNKIMGSLIWTSATVLVSLVCFLAHVYQGNQLTPSIAFTTIALVAMLRQPLNVLPGFINQVYQAKVAFHRIEEYLGEEELNSVSSQVADAGYAVIIKNGSFRWRQPPPQQDNTESLRGSEPFKLKDISIDFPKGKMSVITGPIASGKTSLLLAMLGELIPEKGQVLTNGDAIRYFAQTPWLEHKSIKDNIVFNSEWDQNRYRQVIECCALEQDLLQLELRDDTIIGARGDSLSGGQKARVALARAVYPKKGIILLDDPLKALDASTAQFVVHKLFCGLLANRTVIFATHNVDLVKHIAHRTFHLDRGAVINKVIFDSPGCVCPDLSSQPTIFTKTDGHSPPSEKSHLNCQPKSDGGLSTYFKASSYWTWFAFAILLLCCHGMTVVEKLWLKDWGQAYEGDEDAFAPPSGDVRLSGEQVRIGFQQPLVALPPPSTHPLYYVGVYAAIGCSTAFFNMAAAKMLNTACLRASCSLFDRLLDRVVHAVMHWLEEMPRGSVIDRFQGDTHKTDVTVSTMMSLCCTSFATVLVAALTIAMFFPAFVAPAAIITLSYYLIAIRHFRINSQLTRLDSGADSPVITAFNELLDGLSTIRAFGAQAHLREQFHKSIDVLAKMHYYMWMTTRWLLLRFEALASLVVLVTTVFALSTRVSSGTAGLCITSAMSFTLSVYMVCRFGTQTNAELTAARRIIEYLNIEQEPVTAVGSTEFPENWLTSSQTHSGTSLVSFEDVSVRYSPESRPALDHVTLHLKSRRVGIVGRTGSGKSTLVKTMLRFADPATGRVSIGGVDISTINLHDLRSHITYIPQQPLFFSGTLRENLDPYGQHGQNCANVLENIAARAEIPLPEGGLDCKVDPNNLQFSEGEKQVIALVRAVLNRRSIVILDEATSSVDDATDDKIQQVIREEFKGMLIVIAHRTRTVEDFDYVIVISDGKVIEQGPPSTIKYLQRQIPEGKLVEGI